MDSERIVCYRGKPASELTREELIEAYTKAVKLLENDREFHRQASELRQELNNKIKTRGDYGF